MREPPRRQRLADGRLHLQDGPIDLIIEAFGAEAEIAIAYEAAWARFVTVLDELCAELPLLRAQAGLGSREPDGRVARRMFDAVAPLGFDVFITPMAAVAGAVAEEILEAMTRAGSLTRAYVNNGGDIALHLSPDESFRVGMIDRPDRPVAFGRISIEASGPLRGIATSGRHGRSFSLGVADAVTVLAARAAEADAAATLIANAVDLPGHSGIRRAPANSLDPQSDLGARLVTREVDPLRPDEIEAALASGFATVEQLRRTGRIIAAALHLQGETLVCDAPSEIAPPQTTGISGFITTGATAAPLERSPRHAVG